MDLDAATRIMSGNVFMISNLILIRLKMKQMKSMALLKLIMVPLVILHLSKGWDFLIAFSVQWISALWALAERTVVSVVKINIW